MMRRKAIDSRAGDEKPTRSAISLMGSLLVARNRAVQLGLADRTRNNMNIHGDNITHLDDNTHRILNAPG